MRCAKCGGFTDVADSRALKNGSIRRRRKCKNCPQRFTTYETTIDVPAALRLFEMVKRLHRLLLDMSTELAAATKTMEEHGNRDDHDQ